jgi:hypothetical protein
VSRSAGAPILAAVLLLLAAACAGDDPTRVTLTNDDCTYEGPDSVDAGTVALDIENESDEVGVFELVRIDPGSTSEELESFIAEEQQTPAFVTVVIQLEVNPREASVLNSSLTAGDHAIVCSTGVPPTSVQATESFEAR